MAEEAVLISLGRDFSGDKREPRLDLGLRRWGWKMKSLETDSWRIRLVERFWEVYRFWRSYEKILLRYSILITYADKTFLWIPRARILIGYQKKIFVEGTLWRSFLANLRDFSIDRIALWDALVIRFRFWHENSVIIRFHFFSWKTEHGAFGRNMRSAGGRKTSFAISSRWHCMSTNDWMRRGAVFFLKIDFRKRKLQRGGNYKCIIINLYICDLILRVPVALNYDFTHMYPFDRRLFQSGGSAQLRRITSEKLQVTMDNQIKTDVRCIAPSALQRKNNATSACIRL